MGRFIVIEGADGVGKSSQAEVVSTALKGALYRFPDRSTPYGKVIDAWLKKEWSASYGWDFDQDGRQLHGSESRLLDAMTFQALQTANRLEVLPSLLESLHTCDVVCDRYWQSGYAYGVSDGLDTEHLMHVHSTLPHPHLSILLDCLDAVRVNRLKVRGGPTEAYEQRSEQMAKVARLYRELWEEHEGDPDWVVIDATHSFEEVTATILKAIERRFQRVNK